MLPLDATCTFPSFGLSAESSGADADMLAIVALQQSCF
jgi:hypothetical protein